MAGPLGYFRQENEYSMENFAPLLSGGFGGLGAMPPPPPFPPPPAISGHTKGWMCCYKNTLIPNSDVLYISMYNYIFQRVAPTTPPILLWLAPSHKTLRFKVNTPNLALGGISVLHKINIL